MKCLVFFCTVCVISLYTDGHLVVLKEPKLEEVTHEVEQLDPEDNTDEKTDKLNPLDKEVDQSEETSDSKNDVGENEGSKEQGSKKEVSSQEESEGSGDNDEPSSQEVDDSSQEESEGSGDNDELSSQEVDDETQDELEEDSDDDENKQEDSGKSEDSNDSGEGSDQNGSAEEDTGEDDNSPENTEENEDKTDSDVDGNSKDGSDGSEDSGDRNPLDYAMDVSNSEDVKASSTSDSETEEGLDVDRENEILQRYAAEVAAGNMADLMGTNPHIYQPDKYVDFGRRYEPHYLYSEADPKNNNTSRKDDKKPAKKEVLNIQRFDGNIEDLLKFKDYWNGVLSGKEKAKPRSWTPDNNILEKLNVDDVAKKHEIVPIEAPPELVMLVGKESALLEAAKPHNPADDVIRKKILRTGDYWNGVWKEEVNPKAALRTSVDEPDILRTIKAEIRPGSEFYDIVAGLTKVSPRLLYIMNDIENK